MNPNVARLGYQNFDIRLDRRLVGVTVALGALLLPTACAAEDNDPLSDPTPSISQPYETTPSVEAPSASPEVSETGTYEAFIAKIKSASPEETGDVFVIDGERLTGRDVAAFDSNQGFAANIGSSFDPNNSSHYVPQETETRILNEYGEDITVFVTESDEVFPDDMPPKIRAGMTMLVGTYIYDSIESSGGDLGHDANVGALLAAANNAYRWEAENTGGRNLFDAMPDRSELEKLYYAARGVFGLPKDPGKFAYQDAREAEQSPEGDLGYSILVAARDATESDHSVKIPVGGEDYTCGDFLGAKFMEGVKCNDDEVKLFTAIKENLDEIAESSDVDPASAALVSFYGLRAVLDDYQDYGNMAMQMDVSTVTGVALQDKDITAVKKTLGINTNDETIVAQP